MKNSTERKCSTCGNIFEGRFEFDWHRAISHMEPGKEPNNKATRKLIALISGRLLAGNKAEDLENDLTKYGFSQQAAKELVEQGVWYKKPGISYGIVFIAVLVAFGGAVGGIIWYITSQAMSAEEGLKEIREINEAFSNGQNFEPTGLSFAMRVGDLQQGDCFRIPSLTDYGNVDRVELVPCPDRWTHKMLDEIQVELEGEYPGQNYFEREAQLACSPSTPVYLYPTETSWRQGDRVIQCIQVR